jgi:metal-responsive CopG/Arc/MetJ family transcriptional regulator
MSDAQKDRRVHISMSTEELERLDSWRVGLRIWSRSEAIRLLVAQGLDRAEAKAKAPPGAAKPARKAPAKRKART